jgi:excisionase family DNA binding protein
VVEVWPVSEESEVMTVSEVARYMRVSESTVLMMLRNGQLQGAKVGKSWRVLRSVVDAFLRSGNREPAGRRK